MDRQFLNVILLVKLCQFVSSMAGYYCITLQKHAYSNILRILPPKNENFQVKNSDIFHISAQKIDCGYSLEPPQWGSSNEYPQSMFFSSNKENNIYPGKPQFYYIKVGFIDWLCWGLTTRQPLRVILCRLPEKGRKEIVEEMKERDREERGTGKKVKKQKK